MALIARRQFAKQIGLAAALFARPLGVRGESHWLLGSVNQNGPPADPRAIQEFTSQIVGHVITPGAADYDSARSIFNRAYDLRPAAIVRCGSPSDVARSLEFAQIHHLPLAVRAGGHSRLGFGMCDGGVVVDLSAMKRVEVDRGKRVARAQAGALVRDLDTATQHFGLATTSGGCPTVGIAGFTLGGGEGRLMEKYGAACDNLLSAQVFTVDGRLIEASPQSNADLFWAIRGGGGNFGVVTELEYQLHPVDQVLSGALTYPPGRIADLLQTFVDFLAASPDEMDAFAQLLPSEQGRKLKVDVCYCGDPRRGNDLLRPLRALKPQDDGIKVMSCLEAQAAGGFLAAPVAHFQTNLVVRELSGACIAAIVMATRDAPASCKLIIVPLRGAVTRVGITETAFPLREPGYEIDVSGVWDTPAGKAEVVQWVLATRDSLQPFRMECTSTSWAIRVSNLCAGPMGRTMLA